MKSSVEEAEEMEGEIGEAAAAPRSKLRVLTVAATALRSEVRTEMACFLGVLCCAWLLAPEGPKKLGG